MRLNIQLTKYYNIKAIYAYNELIIILNINYRTTPYKISKL